MVVRFQAAYSEIAFKVRRRSRCSRQGDACGRAEARAALDLQASSVFAHDAPGNEQAPIGGGDAASIDAERRLEEWREPLGLDAPAVVLDLDDDAGRVGQAHDLDLAFDVGIDRGGGVSDEVRENGANLLGATLDGG